MRRDPVWSASGAVTEPGWLDAYPPDGPALRLSQVCITAAEYSTWARIARLVDPSNIPANPSRARLPATQLGGVFPGSGGMPAPNCRIP